MQIKADFYAGIFILCIAALGIWGLFDIPITEAGQGVDSATFPKIILLVLVLLTVLMMARSLHVSASDRVIGDAAITRKVLKFFLTFCCYAGGMVLLMKLADLLATRLPWENNMAFSLSTALFLIAAQLQLGRRSPWPILLVAVGTTVFLVLVFSVFFQVLLP